jgi:predicted dehydrogenase
MSGPPFPRKLRYAMVGGGRDGFIGAVHRHAMASDHHYDLVAGALSSTPDKARASARDLGLAPDRGHGSWQELLAEAEYPRLEDGVRGVRFIERTVASSASTSKWTPF